MTFLWNRRGTGVRTEVAGDREGGEGDGDGGEGMGARTD